ncbi:MAG TPA: tetratricopeptide repeat protein [Candidatus Binataceae bacterium]|nr:tetratricopeptide repeat protein [Candidatus Binataceae bacterium]
MATTQPHHKKISRKELKQPDEFQSFVGNAQEFILNNLQQVIVSVSIVVAAGALAVGIYYYELHRDNVAGDRFYNAVVELNNKNYPQAETDFAKLAQDEPGREVGKLSRFYLASAYLNDDQLPKARDTLIAYIPDAKDDLFASMAYEDLGVIYEKMGDFKKAQGAYAQSATIAGPEQMRAELQVARMLMKQGNKIGAINAYQRFLAAHPFSQDRQTVIEAMADLGAAPAEATPAHATSMPKP